MSHLDLSIMLSNFSEPFITRDLAARIGTAVLEVKYPRNIFQASGSPEVDDEDQFWLVIFKNKLPSGSTLSGVTREMKFRIRKTNGEIVKIS